MAKSTLNLLIWLVWDFSGLRFIYEKINPSEKSSSRANKPSTFMIWLIGIYVALYGISSQRYQSNLEDIKNEANIIIEQMKNDVTRKKALSRLPKIQNTSCPSKPEITRPLTVFESLFKKIKSKYIVDLLKNEVENYKSYLDGVNMSYANLQGIDLRGGSLISAKSGLFEHLIRFCPNGFFFNNLLAV